MIHFSHFCAVFLLSAKKEVSRIRKKRKNLKNIYDDIPQYEITVIADVSGSGKSSFVLGVLYEEG